MASLDLPKAAFFKELETLRRKPLAQFYDADESDEESDPETSARARSREFFRAALEVKPEVAKPVEDSEKKHSVVEVTGQDESVIEIEPPKAAKSVTVPSTIQDSVANPNTPQESIAKGTAQESSAKRPLETPQSKPTIPSAKNPVAKPKTAPPPAKKARRGPKAKPTPSIPESKRFFTGLSMYFLPNDNIAPARRARITKATEYGATWVRRIEEATHVVVDKTLKWAQAEPFVKDRKGAAVLVNEVYTVDCVKFRTLLNPEQGRYRIEGWEPEKKTDDKSEGLERRETTGCKRSYSAIEAGTGADTPDISRWRQMYGLASSQEVSKATVPLDPAEITAQDPAEASTGEPVEPQENTGKDNKGDQLSSCIDMLLKYKDLPVDSDSDSDSSEETPPELTYKHRPKESFACQTGGTLASGPSGPNVETINILQQMCSFYTQTSDQWRSMAYRRAISTLRRQSHAVRSAAQARQLPGIGPRLALKIEEIATTHRLQRLDNARAEPLARVQALFLGVYGAGPVVVQRWMAQGLRSLDDLRARGNLTRTQALGVDHYDDLNTKIPRAEMAVLETFVQRALHGVDEAARAVVCGSYRRGAPASHDIDFLITRKDTRDAAQLVPTLQALVAALEACGFLVAALAGGDRASSKWHGCCVLPRAEAEALHRDAECWTYMPVWRRIDFLVVPDAEIGAAMLYFTGNDIFNRSMRLLASRRGMRLNQHGLWKGVMRGPKRQKITQGELVEAHDEKRIFEILEVQWREPHERWC